MIVDERCSKRLGEGTALLAPASPSLPAAALFPAAALQKVEARPVTAPLSSRAGGSFSGTGFEAALGMVLNVAILLY